MECAEGPFHLQDSFPLESDLTNTMISTKIYINIPQYMKAATSS